MDKKTCRNLTKSIIFCRGKHLELSLLGDGFFMCKNSGCNEIDKLEIHHEIYPRTKKGIIRAINGGKIYLLCGDCHLKKHKEL